MIYVASPYTHPETAVRQRRYDDICTVCADLIHNDQVIISPVMMFHPIDQIDRQGAVTRDHEFWMKRCRELLRKCDRMIVVQLDGWEQSRGVTEEVHLAKLLGIPVEYYKVL